MLISACVFKIAGIYYCVDISIVILLAFSSDFIFVSNSPR